VASTVGYLDTLNAAVTCDGGKVSCSADQSKTNLFIILAVLHRNVLWVRFWKLKFC